MSSLPPDVERAIARHGHDLDGVAKRYGLDGVTLLRKLVKGESGGRKNAVSSAGARGIGQFMPGTRQSMIDKFGLDPWRSADEAIRASIHHLKGDLGHAKGLEGYNPGGGQSYVNYILGQDVGKAPRLRVRARRGGGGERRRDTGRDITLPGRSLTMQSPAHLSPADKLPEVLRFLSGRQDVTQMAMNLGVLEDSLPPTSEEIPLYGPRTVRVGGSLPRSGRIRARRTGSLGESPLKGVNELFWQGPRGVNLDEGHPVAQGYVSGHTDHVHVGADTPQAALRAGRIAQRMGLHVGENPAFGDPVDPAHSSTSFHYRTVNYKGRKVGLGLDVSGSTQQMARYATRIARRAVRAKRRS